MLVPGWFAGGWAGLWSWCRVSPRPLPPPAYSSPATLLFSGRDVLPRSGRCRHTVRQESESDDGKAETVPKCTSGMSGLHYGRLLMRITVGGLANML